MLKKFLSGGKRHVLTGGTGHVVSRGHKPYAEYRAKKRPKCALVRIFADIIK
jgi:hypothetical protein